MELTKIIDFLYLGSHNDVTSKKYKEHNINVIINVAKECEKCEDNEIEHHHFLHNDSPNDKLCDNFDKITDLIHLNVLSKKNVLIHCYAGKSRSATIVIIYLMKYMKYTLNDAYKYVDLVRKIYPNLGFVNQMMEYEFNKFGVRTLDYDSIVIDNIHDTLGFVKKETIKEIYEKLNKDVDMTIDKLFTDETINPNIK